MDYRNDGISNYEKKPENILFTAGLVIGMILSYTGLLGFITGVGTGLFLGNKYERMTNIIIETCTKMVVDKSK